MSQINQDQTLLCQSALNIEPGSASSYVSWELRGCMSSIIGSKSAWLEVVTWGISVCYSGVNVIQGSLPLDPHRKTGKPKIPRMMGLIV